MGRTISIPYEDYKDCLHEEIPAEEQTCGRWSAEKEYTECSTVTEPEKEQEERTKEAVKVLDAHLEVLQSSLMATLNEKRKLLAKKPGEYRHELLEMITSSENHISTMKRLDNMAQRMKVEVYEYERWLVGLVLDYLESQA